MAKIKLTQEELLLKRRQEEGPLCERVEKNLYLQRLPLTNQIEFKKKIRIHPNGYTFLQYLPLILSWAIKTKKIRRKDLDMLLYIHPLMVFTLAQFSKAQREIGIQDNTAYARLKREGWIKLYSQTGIKKHFTLTFKGTSLIIQIHRLVIGDTPFPLKYRHNALVARYDKKQNNSRLEILKEFNRRVQEKTKN